jgi:hypothetical protein
MLLCGHDITAQSAVVETLTSDKLHLVYRQELELANTETIRYRDISLSVAFQSVSANPSFSLRPQVENDLHSGWRG